MNKPTMSGGAIRLCGCLKKLYATAAMAMTLMLSGHTDAMAATEKVPDTWTPVTFNDGVRYSQWVIDSRIRDFYANTTQRGFNVYDEKGSKVSNSAGKMAFDYVPGLVAKAIIEAQGYYDGYPWSQGWKYSVKDYAETKKYSDVREKLTLDNMNACKMYFPLMERGISTSVGETAITQVVEDMNTYNTRYVIGLHGSGITEAVAKERGMLGGWFHKDVYTDQMWCDGLYMGAALLAQIVNYKKSTVNVDNQDDWQLITNQFTISWRQLYNEKTGLLYHAFTANPKDDASKAWAGISATPGKEIYHSEAFWGRACGWYMLALVDVLEQMEINKQTNTNNYKTLKGYLMKLAAGLKNYQDEATGCWYQVLDEKDSHLDGNYLESSCTAIFAAAYLKAIRLELLSSNDYGAVAEKAYHGSVNQFMKQMPDGTVQLVNNCKSAGLGGANNRSGSRDYYVNEKYSNDKPSDVLQSNTYTEGKVFGAFVLAATEYERSKPAKSLYLSSDLLPAYSLSADEKLSVSCSVSSEDAAKATYKWYKDGVEVEGADGAEFAPAVSGKYHCVVTIGEESVSTSTTTVTVGDDTPSGTITISAQPEESTYIVGATAQPLTVAATASNAKECSYRWYSCTDADKSGAQIISGATGASYIPSTETVGTTYYYCEVSASGCATVQSDAVAIVVKEKPATPSNNIVWTFTGQMSGSNATFKSIDATHTDMTYIIGNSDNIVKKNCEIDGVPYESYLKMNGKGSLTKRSMTFNAPSTKAMVTIVYAENNANELIIYDNTAKKELAKVTGSPNTAATSAEFTTVPGHEIVIYAPSEKSYIYSVIWIPIADETEPSQKKAIVLEYDKATIELDRKANPGAELVQPVLKAYVADADGNATEEEVTPLPEGIIYRSDIASVATVAEDGTISIADGANGSATVVASFAGNESYGDATASLNISVKDGYAYTVPQAKDKTAPKINSKKYINAAGNEDDGTDPLVSITFGGWAHNDGKYTAPDGKALTDSWGKTKTVDDMASIDGCKYFYPGTQDAMDEAMGESFQYNMKRTGWFVPRDKDADGTAGGTHPFTLPVRGSFVTLEPTANGTLSVYILQNGVWNMEADDAATIKPGEFRTHVFHVVNQRGLPVRYFSQNGYSVSTKQTATTSYYCDLSDRGEPNPDSKNIALWPEFRAKLSEREKTEIEKKWKSGVNGTQEIVEMDDHSFLAIQRGIVKYTFHVMAKETYYFFSNFSKMGFCGANFVPDDKQPDAKEPNHCITLDETKPYEAPVAPEKSSDGTFEVAPNQKGFIVDGTPIGGNTPVKKVPQFAKISVNRAFKAGQWTTISLPFNIMGSRVEEIFGKGTEIIMLDKATIDNGVAHLHFIYHEIQNILPGYPYLIKPAQDVDGFTITNKYINPDMAQVEIDCGDYVAKTVDGYSTGELKNEANGNTGYSVNYKEGDIFVSDGDGKLYVSEGRSYGKGYRSYIEKKVGTQAVKGISMNYSGVADGDHNTPTEIKFAELAPEAVKALGFKGVYNLKGQRVGDTTENLPAGVYIENGRKLIVE